MALDFSDFLVEEATIADLAAGDQVGVLAEMLDAFARAGVVAREHIPGLMQALLTREGISTTAIGNGIAVPHAKHPSIGRLAGLVARSREGVDFHADNGESTRLFFMILSGPQDYARHLEALARVSRAGNDPMFTRCLLGARDTRGILSYLEKYDGDR